MADPTKMFYGPVQQSERLFAGRRATLKLLAGGALGAVSAACTIATPESTQSADAAPAAGAASATQLTTIGPPTPEQIALYLPTDGTVPLNATATCRYRVQGATSWVTGHPLYRVRQDAIRPPTFGAIQEGFAWPIIDLAPGATYEVEVTVSWTGASQVHTITHTTRSLPSASGATTKTANSVATLITQLASLAPGDVLELSNGTFLLSAPLVVACVGTEAQPIVIRGETRDGVVLSYSGSVFNLQNCARVIFEKFTVNGSGADSGTAASSIAFDGANDNYYPDYLTLRNLTVAGVDRFIYIGRQTHGTLVYDCTADGNNEWTSTYLDSNLAWNDDGIHLPGEGNCAFNNSLTGFGDTFAYASHDGTQSPANAVHYYRNEIKNSCDDAVEADYAFMNCTWYDNRITNAVNADSFDPVEGGPFLSARNIAFNLYRGRAHKWNSRQRGQFLYNNTVISTLPGSTADVDRLGGWYQPDNGAQLSFGFRNNLTVYDQLPSDSEDYPGLSWQVWMSSAVIEVDWTHNAWAPDARFEQVYPAASGVSLAAAQTAVAGSAPTTPIFSGAQRLANDVITAAAVFSPTITYPTSAASEVASPIYPLLASGAAKNSGTVIPGITDGYTGASPDRGAVISGRLRAGYGDRTLGLPAWRQGMAQWEWKEIAGTSMSLNEPSPTPAGNTGPASRINAYCGMACDPNTGRLWTLANGGHQDYSGNEVMFMDLRADAPAWSMLLAPTASGSVLENTAFYSDGRPTSAHTLQNQFWLESIGRVARFGGGYAWITGGSVPNSLYCFNPAANDWDGAGTDQNATPFWSTALGMGKMEAGMCIDASDQVYYTGKGGHLHKYNPATDTVTQYAKPGSYNADWGTGRPAAFDTTRNAAIWLGDAYDATGKGLRWDVGAGTWSVIAFTGLSSAFAGPNSFAAHFSAALDRIIVKTLTDRQILLVDPSTWNVYEQATTKSGVGPSPAASGYMAGRFVYVRHLRGCAYYPEYSGNMWFLATE